MSRIGNQPVAVPSGVEISISGASVVVKGPKGELTHLLPERITIHQEGDELILERPDDERESKALHGLSRSLVSNMITGVSEGYSRTLDIVGVGYRAIAKGNDKLEMSLGYSHTIDVQAPEGVTFDVPTATQIHVVGIDKQAVGQTAANIRALRKPEPYKGKGVRYSDEHVVRKAGKAAK
jgi:large subunit ribosomal protein L6